MSQENKHKKTEKESLDILQAAAKMVGVAAGVGNADALGAAGVAATSPVSFPAMAIAYYGGKMLYDNYKKKKESSTASNKALGTDYAQQKQNAGKKAPSSSIQAPKSSASSGISARETPKKSTPDALRFRAEVPLDFSSKHDFVLLSGESYGSGPCNYRLYATSRKVKAQKKMEYAPLHIIGLASASQERLLSRKFGTQKFCELPEGFITFVYDVPQYLKFTELLSLEQRIELAQALHLMLTAADFRSFPILKSEGARQRLGLSELQIDSYVSAATAILDSFIHKQQEELSASAGVVVDAQVESDVAPETAPNPARIKQIKSMTAELYDALQYCNASCDADMHVDQVRMRQVIEMYISILCTDLYRNKQQVQIDRKYVPVVPRLRKMVEDCIPDAEEQDKLLKEIQRLSKLVSAGSKAAHAASSAEVDIKLMYSSLHRFMRRLERYMSAECYSLLEETILQAEELANDMEFRQVDDDLNAPAAKEEPKELQKRVFISYSRKDAERVTKVYNRLTQAGIGCWMDFEGIYSGDKFAGVITDAIEQCEIFLFFSSANSNNTEMSEWPVNEVTLALEANKEIIPIKLDAARYNKDIRIYLLKRNFEDLSKPELVEEVIKRIIVSIKKKLNIR